MSNDLRFLQQAEGYLELGLPKSAIQALRAMSAAGQAEHPFPFHFYMAEALRECAEFEEAIGHFDKARRERPAEIGTHLGLGWCYKRVGNIEDAIDALLEAERVCQMGKLEGELPLVLYNLSCYYSLAGRKQEMLDRLADALALDKSYLARIPGETDFDPFRTDPDFVRLVSIPPKH